MHDPRPTLLNGATIMSTPSPRHVEIARATGYVGVELRTERLLDDADEAKATAGIVRPGEVWSLNGIQIQVDATGDLRRERLEAELAPRLAICRLLGAAYLLIVPPRIAAVDRERAVGGVRDGVARVRDAAAKEGIGVCFEFLGFADCPIDTPASAARVVEGLDGVGLVLDSCHWHASGSGPLDGFPLDRLTIVHLNDAPRKPPREIEDADRLLPGRGVIRLSQLVATLQQGGFEGPWSLETFNPAYWAEDPSSIAVEGQHAIASLF